MRGYLIKNGILNYDLKTSIVDNSHETTQSNNKDIDKNYIVIQ